jgi:hypothetical protein
MITLLILVAMDIVNIAQGFLIPISRYPGKVKIHAGKVKSIIIDSNVNSNSTCIYTVQKKGDLDFVWHYAN